MHIIQDLITSFENKIVKILIENSTVISADNVNMVLPCNTFRIGTNFVAIRLVNMHTFTTHFGFPPFPNRDMFEVGGYIIYLDNHPSVNRFLDDIGEKLSD